MWSPTAQDIKSAASTRLLFVVRELGSAPLTQPRDRFDAIMVVAQLRDEGPVRFAQRVLERVAAIERAGNRIESATFLMGRSVARAVQAARRLIALGLATHGVVYRDVLEMVLERASGPGPSGQDELFQLAEELLLAMPSGLSLPVRVCLSAGRDGPLAKAKDASVDPDAAIEPVKAWYA